MKRLWAPWRMKYISGISKKDDGAFFAQNLLRPTIKAI